MTPKIRYRRNSDYLEVDRVRDSISGTYLNDADVSVTLTDLEGNELLGQEWPLVLTYVADSDGKFRGILSHEIQDSGIEDAVALIVIDDEDSELHAEISLPLDIQDRTG